MIKNEINPKRTQTREDFEIIGAYSMVDMKTSVISISCHDTEQKQPKDTNVRTGPYLENETTRVIYSHSLHTHSLAVGSMLSAGNDVMERAIYREAQNTS